MRLFRFIVPAGFAISLAAWAASGQPYLYLKLYERTPDLLADRSLGYLTLQATSRSPMPSRMLWYVRPLGNLPIYSVPRLVKLVQDRHIPGVDFSRQPQTGDHDVKSLSDLTALRLLLLDGTSVTDAGLHAVGKLKMLEVFAAPEAMTHVGLSHLSGLANLRELILTGGRIHDASLPAIARFSHLETLDLSGTDAHDLRALAPLRELHRLTLSSAVSDEDLPALNALSDLRQLDLSETKTTDAGLEAIRHLSLETLFTSPTITDEGLAIVASMRSLKRLDVSGADVTDAGIVSLAPLADLRELAIDESSVTVQAMQSLAQLPQLDTLEMSDTAMTTQGLAPLIRLINLKVVSFSWNGTPTETDLAPLGAMPHLKLVLINGRALAPETLRHLRSAVQIQPIETAATMAGSSTLTANRAGIAAVPTVTSAEPPITAMADKRAPLSRPAVFQTALAHEPDRAPADMNILDAAESAAASNSELAFNPKRPPPARASRGIKHLMAVQAALDAKRDEVAIAPN